MSKDKNIRKQSEKKQHYCGDCVNFTFTWNAFAGVPPYICKVRTFHMTFPNTKACDKFKPKC